MKRLLGLLLLIFIFSYVNGQLVKPAYRLQTGQIYGISVSASQNTITESGGIEQNVSMDIRAIYHFRPDSITPAGHYFMTAWYSQLSLSMVAPLLNISLNPDTPSGKLLQAYLTFLEKQVWHMEMDESGDLTGIWGLDPVFAQMYNLPAGEAEEQDVIVKTLKEAFGHDALTSICNTILHLYPEYPSPGRWESERQHFINTRPVSLHNKWYYSLNRNREQLIQGIGIITGGSPDTTDMNGIVITSAVSGNQTYDYQTDPESGWMIRGESRQRIVVRNLIINNPSFPEGIEVPSYTETIYSLRQVLPAPSGQEGQGKKKTRVKSLSREILKSEK